MQFDSDFDALKLLAAHGIQETENGIIKADLPTLCPDCEAAILYLCKEWDFVFEDTNAKTMKGQRHQCEGSDDPEERCPRHPDDCVCWEFDPDHPAARPIGAKTIERSER